MLERLGIADSDDAVVGGDLGHFGDHRSADARGAAAGSTARITSPGGCRIQRGCSMGSELHPPEIAAAQGETTIGRVYHLDRGFDRLEEKLRNCGAQIERLSD